MRLSGAELAQAWYSGHLKQWQDVPNAYHKSSHTRQTLSSKKLLVRIRQIIRAHTAAAATAPAAQQLPVRARHGVAVQLPPETFHISPDAAISTAGLSAAGGLMPAETAQGSADAAGWQLGWGDINIQKVLTVDPSLLLVSAAIVPQTGCLWRSARTAEQESSTLKHHASLKGALVLLYVCVLSSLCDMARGQ
jgi:hypothetical protein